MSCLIRDDVTWSDWLAVRRRAHGAAPDVIAALAAELRDWPDAIRQVASDPEQKIDEWWIEGATPAPQPWLTLVRSLWVPAEELLELEADSAWSNGGLSGVTNWVVGQALASDLTQQCRARLPGLTTIDLTHFAGPGLDGWVQRLGPVEQLRFGGVAANKGLIETVAAHHAATLSGLELNGLGLGVAGLRRLSEWPSSSRLLHLAVRDDSIELGMFGRVPLPWLTRLSSLDLSGVAGHGRQHKWLVAPDLELLSLNQVRLTTAATDLFGAAQLPRLRRLRVASTQLDIAGLDAAVNGSSRPTLACLDIRNNSLPDEALDVLARPAGPGWTQLLISGNHFTAEAVRRFATQHALVFVSAGELVAKN